MTYYHGQENAPLVFSGTSIWDFRRQDCLALVDFVLGRLWGLSKSTALRAARRGARPHAASGRSHAEYLPATVRGGSTAGRHLNLPALALTGAVE